MNVKDFKIVVNDGDLVNIDDETEDIKIDDPTTESSHLSLQFDTEMKYTVIYGETMKFINDNNEWLQYPRLWLKSVKYSNAKCTSNNCQRCHSDENDSNSTNDKAIGLCLCESQRKEIGNELFSISQQRSCLSDSLTKTVSQLCMSDQSLSDQTQNYTLKQNWFAKTYSYLKWQQEMAGVLLESLANFETNGNNDNIISEKFD